MSLLPIATPARTRSAVHRLLRPHRTLAALAFAVLLASTTAGLATAPLLGRIVDLVAANRGAGAITVPVVLLVLAAVGQGVLLGVGSGLVAQLGERMLARLRERFVERALGLPLDQVERAGSGDLISRVSDDVTVIAEAVRNALPALARSALTIALTLAGMAVLDWRFLAAALLAVPIQLHTVRWYARRAGPLYARQRVAVGAQRHQLLDTFGGAATVRAFRLTDVHSGRIRDASQAAVDLALTAARLWTRFFGRLNFAELIGLAAVLTTGFLLVRGGEVSLGTATAAALYFHGLFNPINVALALVDDAQAATASLARLVGVAGEPDEGHLDTGDRSKGHLHEGGRDEGHLHEGDRDEGGLRMGGQSGGGFYEGRRGWGHLDEGGRGGGHLHEGERGEGGFGGGGCSGGGLREGDWGGGGLHEGERGEGGLRMGGRSGGGFGGGGRGEGGFGWGEGGFGGGDGGEGGLHVVVRGVHHAYRLGKEVLQGVDLEIHSGERVALVGVSGAGKSTLAKLIAGVHRPTRGSVRVGGRVVLVTQEVHVFAGPLADDLRLGRAKATDAQLGDALGRVGALAWVGALPEGMATIVGEGGHRLTAAQAQQLALARVILADPPIVILDEATAEAGSAGARLLEKAAGAALAGRSALIVAHRLTQAASADRVVVLDGGRVVESGTHEELVAAGGHYAVLWDAWSSKVIQH
ncbi:MAG TPA: ABC transporter ATP-binding protein [Actinophytocola sp.]|uniref:ABC transporter ATP-binding protein n=1 Tax=Actinophytocola sp. TaxID=1872138 RepID=UPI002DDDB7FC|nr:ABC transporter ATP-binding protein [Actinophytocola sp.]HEV2782398.1 ABC transporter ATP-binding protein [Actinophytocola sp.]